MSRLEDAIRAAEARKAAVLDFPENDTEIGVNFTTDWQSRLVISGFGIDWEELHELAGRAGHLFAQLSLNMLPVHSHEAAWTEGLLIGLFAGSLPPASEAGDMEVTGPEDIPND